MKKLSDETSGVNVNGSKKIESREATNKKVHSAESKVKCIHCQTDMDILPPYNVEWSSEAWINCPNIKCQRPNKFLFLKGGNISIKNITKFKSTASFLSSNNKDDAELGKLMKEVEDSHVHDRHRGAAIVIRVCLEQFIWIRTLNNKPEGVTTGKEALEDLKKYLQNNNCDATQLKNSEDAFEFIADLGDTAAHYALRNPSRTKLPTEANVAMAIRKFDTLREIISNVGGL